MFRALHFTQRVCVNYSQRVRVANLLITNIVVLHYMYYNIYTFSVLCAYCETIQAWLYDASNHFIEQIHPVKTPGMWDDRQNTFYLYGHGRQF